MEILSKIKGLKIHEIPDLEGWIGDAKFGINQLSPYFYNKNKFEVLEVGCGIGILLASLKEKFPNLSVEGIEPYLGGFGRLEIAKNGHNSFLPRILRLIFPNFAQILQQCKISIAVVGISLKITQKRR